MKANLLACLSGSLAYRTPPFRTREALSAQREVANYSKIGNDKLRLSVLGAGYLGAIHATCMAQLGHDVKVYDVDISKIDSLSHGLPTFYEPGFEELLSATLKSGNIEFTKNAKDAIQGSEAHFICVGTPQQQNSDAADLRSVDSAFEEILRNADCDGTIIGKSTVPVGTARRLSRLASNAVGTPNLGVAWNPEFLREGTAIKDTLAPDRLVFGVECDASVDVLKAAYRSLLEDGTPYVICNFETSEMVKVAANSFLATKISFINAMSEICEVANADIVVLSRALGYDARIGSLFMNAGLGFGGGCLPKDIRAFSARAGELGAPDAVSFLREIDKINIRRRERVVAMAATIFDGDFLGRRVAILGAAFKPNSDDVRDSPALNVAAAMHLKGALVCVHDPKAIDNAKRMFPTLRYSDDARDACLNADLVVLATEWSEYREISPAELRSSVTRPILIDGRNFLDHELWSACGWKVYGLGRGNLLPINHPTGTKL